MNPPDNLPPDPDNLEGPGRTPEQMAADARELNRIAPTPADKFRLMFGATGVEARVYEWQNIETAPRDGTQILGTWADTWTDGAPHIEAIECGELGGWFYSYDGDGPPDHKPPTHWMPLPQPPAERSDHE